MDIGNHEIGVDHRGEFFHRHIGIPEFVQAAVDSRASIREQRRLIRWPKGTPAAVLVGLVQNVGAHFFSLGLGVFGNDRPAARDDVVLFRGLAVILQRLNVNIPADSPGAEEAVCHAGRPVDGRRRHAPGHPLFAGKDSSSTTPTQQGSQ